MNQNIEKYTELYNNESIPTLDMFKIADSINKPLPDTLLSKQILEENYLNNISDEEIKIMLQKELDLIDD